MPAIAGKYIAVDRGHGPLLQVHVRAAVGAPAAIKTTKNPKRARN
jgi:hypothetical protein